MSERPMVPVRKPANAKIICAYCSRSPAEGVALKRVPGLKLYYCMKRRGEGWRRECVE